jgi:hypothetical protein
MKERLSCSGLLEVMKHGCTTVNLKANVKGWCGNTSPRNKKLKKKNSKVSSASRAMLMLLWDKWACSQALQGSWTDGQ